MTLEVNVVNVMSLYVLSSSGTSHQNEFGQLLNYVKIVRETSNKNGQLRSIACIRNFYQTRGKMIEIITIGF